MRDFRDAKLMAASLRKALRDQGLPAPSQSLEAIAKAFGLDNWNVLAAKIEGVAASASRRCALAARRGYRGFATSRPAKSGTPTRPSCVEDRPMRLVLYTPLGSAMQASKLDWSTGRFDGPHRSGAIPPTPQSSRAGSAASLHPVHSRSKARDARLATGREITRLLNSQGFISFKQLCDRLEAIIGHDPP